MKNLFCFLLLLVSLSLAGQEADRFDRSSNDRPRDIRTDQMNFVPNEVLVKFRDEVNLSSGRQLKSAGISNIDQVLKNHGISSLERLFPEAKKLKSARIIKDPQGRDMKIPNLDNIFRIKVPQLKSTGSQPTNIFPVIEELKALPEVEYAEPNFIYSIGDFTPSGREMTMLEAMVQPANSNLPLSATGLVPNDPLYNSQWGIPATNIDDVWNTTTGDSTSIIAILDTGVDWSHPDLSANIWKNKQEIPGNGRDDDSNGKVDDIRGWDFINNDNDPKDDNSHGTHCAGIAAAVGNNGIGIAGVNWNAKIMAIKVFQSSGKGDAATIASGVTYAANNGAKVISMSFGSYAESLTLKNALASAYASAVLVAAAGNDALCIGPGLCPDRRLGAPMYPGGYSFVLGVEANSPDKGAGFSNFDQDGPVFSNHSDLQNYELKAPGVGIISTIPGGNYREYNGTSMAAPLVAGAVSLYRKQRPIESQELLFGNFVNSIGQHIDLEKALNIIPEPRLDIVSYAVTDTLDGDKDGRPDVGETIELKVKVRNTWGQAGDVKVGLEFGEFEDRATASILTNEATVGSVSAYASRENTIPLKIKLASDINDGRDIVFKLKSWYGDHQGEKSQNITINIENGIELKGIISNNLTLYPSKHYIITDNIAIPEGITLTIKPGTVLKFGDMKSIVVSGIVSSIGKPDSLITFTKRDNGLNWNQIVVESLSTFKADFTVFENAGNFKNNNNFIFNNNGSSSLKITNSIFRNNGTGSGDDNIGFKFGNNCLIQKNSFYNNTYRFYGIYYPNGFSYNNIISNVNSCWEPTCSGAITLADNFTSFLKNNIFSNYSKNSLKNIEFGGNSNSFKVFKLDSIYYGTTNEKKINDEIYDFQERGVGIWYDISNKLSKPSREAHGIVWKVVVNGKDAQDEYDKLDPLGVGKQKFQVYFNRAMDTKFPPTVSMGVRSPYTQTAIAEDGTWSADSTIYTVYKNIGLTTGDGINTIRVAGAKDMDHFEIPIEDRRFHVVVNAASSASAEFQATPAMGKINMEWNNDNLEDGLGYNMYRMENINDSTLSKPKLINSTLIADTLYTDFNVTPNKKYYYYYKVLRTNLTETDSSKVVSAVPLTASKGDANGDTKVNLLDITTLVSYLLNNNPQPFIAEAADANSDGSINVLDVVGVVNQSLLTKSAYLPSLKQAHLYMMNDTLFADAPVPVGGIQFEISSVSSMDEVEKLPAIKGFESGYRSSDKGLFVLYYSLSGKNIPAGKRIPLLRLKQGSSIGSGIFADENGLAILLELSAQIEEKPVIPNPALLIAELGQNYPNPLKLNEQTIIPIQIYQPVDEAVIRIVNMAGQVVEIIRVVNPTVGEHLVTRSMESEKGYLIYTLEVRQGNKRVMSLPKKMVVK